MIDRKNYLNKVREAMRSESSSSGRFVTATPPKKASDPRKKTTGLRITKQDLIERIEERIKTYEDQPEKYWSAKDRQGYIKALETEANNILDEHLFTIHKKAG